MVDLLIRNENIQHLYDWYNSELFLVNRKYQRKLVWTIEEKQKFINSILKHYPIPLFLLASNSDGRYEIIDGMQRLNAIFAFIKGEFSVQYGSNNGYFDLQTMASAKALLDNGELIQKYPLLDRSLCTQFVNYQLPLSVTSFDDKHIEEIFRRLNATGRQLSAQDLRQAGATHAFSELVRKVSTEIRRDSSTSDILGLSQMEEISLSNHQLPYGINLENTFWVKNGIITVKNMRISRDEELVAYLLLRILLGKDVIPSAKNLDRVYGYDTDDKDLLIEKTTISIEKRTVNRIKDNFLNVLDQIQKTVDASGKNLSTLLFKDKPDGMVRSFQVIFLAFYDLLTENKIIENYYQLAQEMDGIGNKLLSKISGDRWSASDRNSFVNAIRGVIEKHFIANPGEDPAVDEWISKLENLLMQSKIEQQFFDFKIGLHDVSSNPEYNQKCLSKIVKTLTAMANTQKNSTGYVIVGIADKEADANRFSSVYGVNNRKYNGFYITGVQEEIKRKYSNADDYFSKRKLQ